MQTFLAPAASHRANWRLSAKCAETCLRFFFCELWLLKAFFALDTKSNWFLEFLHVPLVGGVNLYSWFIARMDLLRDEIKRQVRPIACWKPFSPLRRHSASRGCHLWPRQLRGTAGGCWCTAWRQEQWWLTPQQSFGSPCGDFALCIFPVQTFMTQSEAFTAVYPYWGSYWISRCWILSLRRKMESHVEVLRVCQCAAISGLSTSL